MTGFGRADGTAGGHGFVWELRSVNGRGLDLRLRLPPGCDALEPALREAAGQLKRGNVSATLTLVREAEAKVAIDNAALDQALAAATALAARIAGAPPPRAEALLALPGVMRAGREEFDPAADETAAASLREGFATALAALLAARLAEGARLAEVVGRLLDEIAALRERAEAEAADQPRLHRERLAESLRQLLGATPPVAEERLAQEIALLATRSDVREELDRLAAHLAAARALLAEGEAIGRKLDFLVQEFLREANTLCSKSASAALTTTGLALKAAIEQLREQVQNIA
ncbi:MAG: YicC family protein [Rhodospirillales bacterium]|nr:YicC family protein [Rhodospirillales bacterium]